MTRTAKGYILGAVAAVSYGTNPLFAVPLYRMGLGVPSVLFYRYFLATLLLGLIMLCRGDRFRVSCRQLLLLCGLGVMFALSSVLLFEAYNHMDVGLASTLLFMEPVFIALILWLGFRERISPPAALAIALCIPGIAALSNPGPGARVTLMGVSLVILSALAYAIYMVAVNKSRIRGLPGVTITFYSLLLGMTVLAVMSRGFTAVQPVPASVPGVVCVLGIAIFPTIVSLLTVTVAVQYVGSVPVAILGALEPITGVLFGVLLFGEVLTPKAAVGVALILSAVITLILARNRQP